MPRNALYDVSDDWFHAPLKVNVCCACDIIVLELSRAAEFKNTGADPVSALDIRID